jgi:hypothetical protein
MSKGSVLGLGFTLAVVLLAIFAVRGVRRVNCKVCVTYEQQTVCRNGSGKSKQDAVKSAQRACCAELASGMTESIKCENLQPDSVDCD